MVKTLAALAEGPGVPVPAPTRQIPTVYNPSARDLATSSDLHGHQEGTPLCVLTYTQTKHSDT